MTKELMQADLDLECLSRRPLVQLLVLVLDERNLLVWWLRTENVAKGHILETLELPYGIVIGDVYASLSNVSD